MRKKRDRVGWGGVFILSVALLGGGFVPMVGRAQTDPPPPPPGGGTQAIAGIRLGEAVIMALTNNRALHVQRLNPGIQQTFEERERALFDPVLAGSFFVERNPPDASSVSTNSAGENEDIRGGALGVRQRLATGTEVGINLETAHNSTEASYPYTTRAAIDITQALLQGRPVAVNLVDLRQARLDTEISRYELEGFAETLVAEVEWAYWEYALIRRQGEIVKESLNLAEQQLQEIEHRIRVGDLPETELAAAQAELALRREALINTRSGLSKAQLQLLRLINPAGLSGLRTELILATEPAIPDTNLGSLESHLELALRLRPDLNQARLQRDKGDLELVKTRNGLLPRLDLFVTLGDTAYAASFNDAGRDLDGHEMDVLAGVRLEYPFRNRESRSSHQRALMTREQATEALQNMTDLVRVDVETAYIEVERSREQVAATATTRKFQEEKVRAETVKFKVGRSTAILVAQAQRDLLASRVSEAEAVARHLQAWVMLFRRDGSLLKLRGLTVSGP